MSCCQNPDYIYFSWMQTAWIGHCLGITETVPLSPVPFPFHYLACQEKVLKEEQTFLPLTTVVPL